MPDEAAPTVEQVVASRFKEVRNLRGWSQAELARRMTEEGTPMTQTAIARLESGRRGVLVGELVTAAAVMNVSPAALLFPDPESTPTIRIGAADYETFRALIWTVGGNPLWPMGWPLATDEDPATPAGEYRIAERLASYSHASALLLSALYKASAIHSLSSAEGPDQFPYPRFKPWPHPNATNDSADDQEGDDEPR